MFHFWYFLLKNFESIWILLVKYSQRKFTFILYSEQDCIWNLCLGLNNVELERFKKEWEFKKRTGWKRPNLKNIQGSLKKTGFLKEKVKIWHESISHSRVCLRHQHFFLYSTFPLKPFKLGHCFKETLIWVLP